MAVLMVFPAFMLPVCVIKSVILFNRGQRIDKDVRSFPHIQNACCRLIHYSSKAQAETRSGLNPAGAKHCGCLAEVQ
jgi:hypothetical protein